MEAIVDAYGPEEQAMGWYYYLQDRLAVPFRARCVAERTASPLREGETVTVSGMAPEDDCRAEMVVLTEWAGRRRLALLGRARVPALRLSRWARSRPSRRPPSAGSAHRQRGENGARGGA